MKKLAYENERLRAENAFLKTESDLKPCTAREHLFGYSSRSASGSTQHTASMLGCRNAEVRYYKSDRKASADEEENRELTEMMMAMYEKVEGIFGYR
ncbi:hypothetical protein [Paenibacillus gansuensis]|uniref:Transposase n=1 Tax=Paenibacillus gansuensis TaxID=306542 RepID=A0ABW5PJ41_9BACL